MLNLNDGSFITLTKNLTTLLILLSTCQHLLNNCFQTILLVKILYYEDTLSQASYINKLVYHALSSSNLEKIKKNCLRNFILFNPPYSKIVTTRLGHSFLHLTDTHFPKYHTFNKIFNKNKEKVSYSCIQNMKTIINNHNMNILQNNNIKEECNCRNKIIVL